MWEQSVNQGDKIRKTKGFLKGAYTIALCALISFSSACMPLGNQEVNKDLFKSKEEMQARASELKPGTGKEAVFEQLKVKPEKFSRMSLQDVQTSVYGNSQVQGTPEQLEAFRQRLMNYDGYALPYREIKSNGSLGFGTMKTNKNGYDLRLVLIFEKGRLVRASVDGNQDVNQDDNQYIWATVLKKTTGIGF